MELERILSVAGSLASLISLSLPPLMPSQKVSESDVKLNLFRSLADVAYRWKCVHNQYHLIFHDLRNVKEIFDAYSKSSDINFSEVQKKFNHLGNISQKSKTFRRDVSVYMGAENKAQMTADEIEKKSAIIKKSVGSDYATKAKLIYYSQIDALDSHTAFSDAMDLFYEIFVHLRLNKESIDFNKVADLYNNFDMYYNNYNVVILKTDEVLLNVIDYFKLISDAE